MDFAEEFRSSSDGKGKGFLIGETIMYKDAEYYFLGYRAGAVKDKAVIKSLEGGKILKINHRHVLNELSYLCC